MKFRLLAKRIRRSEVGVLLSDSTLYFGAILVNRGIRFLVVPILAYTLPPDTLGVYDAARSLIGLGTPIVGLGMESAMAVTVMGRRQQDEYVQNTETNALLLICVASIAFLIGVGLTDDLLYAVFMDRSGGIEFLWLAAVTISLAAPANYARNLLKWQFRRKAFVFLLVGEAALTVTLGFSALVLADLGLVGWMYAVIIANVAVLAAGLWVSRGTWTIRLRAAKSKALLRLGLPFAAASVSTAGIPVAVRTALVHQAGMFPVGVYGVGERIGMIGGLVASGFTTAWGPFYLSRQHDEESPDLFGRVALYYLVASLWLAIVISSESEFIVSVIASESYSFAARLVPFLIVVQLIIGFEYIVAAGIFIKKRPRHLVWIAILSAVAGGAVTFVLAPQWGAMGAAIGALIGKAISVTISTIVSQVYFEIDYPQGEMLKAVACAGLAWGALMGLDVLLGERPSGVGFVVTSLGFPLGIHASGVIRAQQVRSFFA